MCRSALACSLATRWNRRRRGLAAQLATRARMRRKPPCKWPICSSSWRIDMVKMHSGGSRARSQARRLALQGLYQWQLSGATAAEISVQLLASQKTRDTDAEYFEALLGAAIADSNTLEALFSE